MTQASVEFVRKARRRCSWALSGVLWRALFIPAWTGLRLAEYPSVRLAWEAAKTRRLLAGLSSHGERVSVQHPVTIHGGSAVRVGDDVAMAAYVHIWGSGGVTIGDRVMIGTHTSITSLSHDHTQEKMRFTLVALPVTIGDDVWIGSNCVVLPGIHLGQGSVVGAGSVVAKDVPPFSIVAGVPAQVIDMRLTNRGDVKGG